MCYKNSFLFSCGHRWLDPHLYVCDMAAKNISPNPHCKSHWRVRWVSNALPDDCAGCVRREAEREMRLAETPGDADEVEKDLETSVPCDSAETKTRAAHSSEDAAEPAGHSPLASSVGREGWAERVESELEVPVEDSSCIDHGRESTDRQIRHDAVEDLDSDNDSEDEVIYTPESKSSGDGRSRSPSNDEHRHDWHGASGFEDEELDEDTCPESSSTDGPGYSPGFESDLDHLDLEAADRIAEQAPLSAGEEDSMGSISDYRHNNTDRDPLSLELLEMHLSRLAANERDIDRDGHSDSPEFRPRHAGRTSRGNLRHNEMPTSPLNRRSAADNELSARIRHLVRLQRMVDLDRTTRFPSADPLRRTIRHAPGEGSRRERRYSSPATSRDWRPEVLRHFGPTRRDLCSDPDSSWPYFSDGARVARSYGDDDASLWENYHSGPSSATPQRWTEPADLDPPPYEDHDSDRPPTHWSSSRSLQDRHSHQESSRGRRPLPQQTSSRTQHRARQDPSARHSPDDRRGSAGYFESLLSSLKGGNRGEQRWVRRDSGRRRGPSQLEPRTASFQRGREAHRVRLQRKDEVRMDAPLSVPVGPEEETGERSKGEQQGRSSSSLMSLPHQNVPPRPESSSDNPDAPNALRTSLESSEETGDTVSDNRVDAINEDSDWDFLDEAYPRVRAPAPPPPPPLQTGHGTANTTPLSPQDAEENDDDNGGSGSDDSWEMIAPRRRRHHDHGSAAQQQQGSSRAEGDEDDDFELISREEAQSQQQAGDDGRAAAPPYTDDDVARSQRAARSLLRRARRAWEGKQK